MFQIKNWNKKPKRRQSKTKIENNSIMQTTESGKISDTIISHDPIVVKTEQEMIELLKSDGDVNNMISSWVGDILFIRLLFVYTRL